MKLSFSTIIFVILVLLFSVFVANISNLIAVQVENSMITEDGQIKISKSNKLETSNTGKENSKGFRTRSDVMKDGHDHLMWFLQVSPMFLPLINYSCVL